MSAIWVEITKARGSTPRDAGTAMMVTPDASEGTIGGGALEYQAISIARKLIAEGGPETTQTFPLGPDLGQCCGGAVRLLFTRDQRRLDREHACNHEHVAVSSKDNPLWIWGAGHVGRAVVRALPSGAFDVTWVDSSQDRFPTNVPDRIKAIPATDMPMLAARAPTNARHLIFTYSHDIDLALCAALLVRGAASIGLIGSDTKRARFFKRLRAMGLDPAPITCPIGDKSLGKAPQAIASGVVARLLSPAKTGAMG